MRAIAATFIVVSAVMATAVLALLWKGALEELALELK